jgi:hypothetical protein
MSKPLKIILFTVSGVVGLLVLIAVAFVIFVDANAYKPHLESTASKALGLDVSIGGRVAKEAQLGIELLPLRHKELRVAPRRPTRFSEVWAAALSTTALLLVAEGLFVIYLKHFATLNAVYGALGGIMALLLWIYLSGGILIFGACLSAAQKEIFLKQFGK